LATPTPEAVKILKRADPDTSPASWALRFAGSLDNVFTVLSGISDSTQVEDDRHIGTFAPSQPLSDNDRETVAAAPATYRAAGAVPCTSCRYRMPCPSCVDIPKSFASVNNYKCTGTSF
jgi:predicted aldo/keto reductase-like oxidoreductase